MKLYSIGQASEMIGVPIPTIRYYESVELCKPSFIDADSGYRYYSIDDIFRLDLIRCLGRQLGMPLKQIRSFLSECQDPEAIKKYLQQQEQSIDMQIQELSRRREFISEKLAAIKKREEVSILEAALEFCPEEKLSAHVIEADCLEDAILMARRTAGEKSDKCREINLILDGEAELFEGFFGKRRLTVALSEKSADDNNFSLTIPSGNYVFIYYPNRDEYRTMAHELLFGYIRENGLVPCGSIICSGSLIDTTSVSSLDYLIKLRIRVQ